MKKIFDNKLFIFFIGVILSSGITYAATLLADNVSYDNTDSGMNANNVQDAIDELYTKANQTIPDTYKDLSTPVTANSSDLLYGKTAYKQDGTIVTGTINTYNGTTNVTPTTSSQTIETGSKYVGSNITVGAIPSLYKNLSTTTTALASDLLSGKTAYNSSGELITGNISNNCVSGSFVCGDGCVGSSGQTILSYIPSKWHALYTNNNNETFVEFMDSGYDYYIRVSSYNNGFTGSASAGAINYYDKTNHTLKIKDQGETYRNVTFYYIACR